MTFEQIVIRVKPDGKLDVSANNWAEGQDEMEVDQLVARLQDKGAAPVKAASQVEYTGEVHSQYHHLCGHDHQHGGHGHHH